MNRYLRLLCSATLSLLVLSARTENQSISRDQAEALVSGLKFQQGEMTLGCQAARAGWLVILNGPDAKTVLAKLWGNPPSSTDPLGMLMPDGNQNSVYSRTTR